MRIQTIFNCTYNYICITVFHSFTSTSTLLTIIISWLSIHCGYYSYGCYYCGNYYIVAIILWPLLLWLLCCGYCSCGYYYTVSILLWPIFVWLLLHRDYYTVAIIRRAIIPLWLLCCGHYYCGYYSCSYYGVLRSGKAKAPA